MTSKEGEVLPKDTKRNHVSLLGKLVPNLRETDFLRKT